VRISIFEEFPQEIRTDIYFNWIYNSSTASV